MKTRRAIAFAMSRVPTMLGVVVAASLLIVSAAPAKPYRAPSGAAFYTAPSPLPAMKHGDVIWSRTASRANGLAGARSNRLVLYRSMGVAGRIAVSGIVSVPRGRPPRGGWPVVTWAHGTTGIADRCAPTRNPRHWVVRLENPLRRLLLKRGYAVVATDYEGLGPPRYVHPFGNGPSEGRGVLDIVRAARRLDRRIGRRVIIAGASQGGQAALFAASLAPRYTPELKVRGTVAFAPMSHVGEQLPLVTALTAPNAISTFAMFFARGLDLARPSLHVRAGLSDIANARYGELDRRCVDEAERGLFADIAPADLFKPGTDFADDIRALEQLTDPENLTIRTPVRIDQGTADTRTFPVHSEQTIEAYRARGTRVTYKAHEGASHTGVLKAAADDATAWISRRLR